MVRRFRVWAEQIIQDYHDVEANSPEEAMEKVRVIDFQDVEANSPEEAMEKVRAITVHLRPISIHEFKEKEASG